MMEDNKKENITEQLLEEQKAFNQWKKCSC